MIGVTPGVQREGSIKPLLRHQSDVQLTSVALNPSQVCAMIPVKSHFMSDD